MNPFFTLLLGIGTAHADDAVLTIPGPGTVTTVPDLFNRALDLLTFAAYPLGFLCLLFCAWLLLTSAGKPEAWTTAKTNLLNLVLGIFLIVFAAIIVRFITHLFR